MRLDWSGSEAGPAGASRSMRLLFHPGLDGTDGPFQPLLESLPPNVRAKAVAYPPDQPLGYRDLLPLIEEAANDLGDFVVLGKSLSGPLA